MKKHFKMTKKLDSQQFIFLFSYKIRIAFIYETFFKMLIKQNENEVENLFHFNI